MKKLLVVFCCCFLFNCSEKKEQASTSFLKNNTLELAPPRVVAPSTIIDSIVTVNAELKMEGVTIRYTYNGEEPTENSMLYQNSLELSKEGKYKFKAFHQDWKPSATSEIELFKKGIKPQAFLFKTEASKVYPGIGKGTLFNNKKASLAFKDIQWLGYDTTTVAVVDFKTSVAIKKITIGYLVDTKSWIFPPEKVSVIINEEDSVSVVIPKFKEGEYKRLNSVKIPINKVVETLKIKVVNSRLPDWHPGASNGAWLFMDEWIFN